MATSAAARSTARTRRPAARATAVGRSAPVRRAPARKPAASPPAPRPRRRSNTPVTGFVPVAAARTAGAVGGLADSGVVVRLTRSRLWIGLLGALLVGIVGLNVLALSFSSSSSAAARQSDELKLQNSALRAQIASRLSNEQIQVAATELGLSFANPGAIRYVHPSAEDAALAAKRLRSGELSASDYLAPVTAPVVPADSVTAPVEEVAVEAAPVSEPSAAAPVPEAAPVAPEVAPVVDPPDPAAGGAVAAP